MRAISDFLFIILGCLLYSKNLLTIPTFVIIYNYQTKVKNLLMGIAQLLEYNKKFTVASDRIYEVIEDKTFEKEKFGELEIKKLTGSIKFENVRVDRDFSNVTNRLLNCDTYNYKKTIQNSSLQIDYIKFIDKKLGIKNISNPKIKNLCLLRLQYPEATYSDLAKYLSEEMEVSISKSNINHLFRAIKELAIKLNYEN